MSPPSEAGEPLLRLHGVGHGYRREGEFLPILQEVSLEIRRGEACAVVGASGSGKSTLLNLLGLLDLPATGDFHFAGRNVRQATGDELAGIRNREIGFVFQAFNLLPRLSALENVALPLRYRGVPRRAARWRALAQLEQVGLAERSTHRPAELSGGQCQRVAIARALVGAPALILADEPTGNLDQRTAENILALLMALHQEWGVTLVMVTHDPRIAAAMPRRLEMQRGTLHD